MTAATEAEVTALRDAVAILLARAREDDRARAALETPYFESPERTRLLLDTFQRLSEGVLREAADRMRLPFEHLVEDFALVLAYVDRPSAQGTR